MPALGNKLEDEGGPPALAPISSRRKTYRLAITNGDESTGSMPGLQSVSNSSDDDGEDDDDDDDDEFEDENRDGNDSPVSGYNSDEEEELRGMIKEAMFFAREGDFYDSGDNMPSEINPFLQAEKDHNPFLKLLGSLRGPFVLP